MKKMLLLFLYPVLLCTSVAAQNVGVGTSNPVEKLDVNGNINVTGTIKANGTDGTPNQVLMKNGSGNLTWSGMPYPPSAFDTSAAFLSQTARNSWVTDPGISVTVPETGKYLISFYGSMFNNNETLSSQTSYDSDGQVRLFNSTTSTEIFSTVAISYYSDLYTPNDAKRKYRPMRPCFSIMVNLLTANDVLRLQYFQSAFGSPLPTGSWYIGNGGISILKTGN